MFYVQTVHCSYLLTIEKLRLTKKTCTTDKITFNLFTFASKTKDAHYCTNCLLLLFFVQFCTFISIGETLMYNIVR